MKIEITFEPKQERDGKRRNIKRWRESRLRRLSFCAEEGWATPRQLARIEQLDKLVRFQP